MLSADFFAGVVDENNLDMGRLQHLRGQDAAVVERGQVDNPRYRVHQPDARLPIGQVDELGTVETCGVLVIKVMVEERPLAIASQGVCSSRSASPGIPGTSHSCGYGLTGGKEAADGVHLHSVRFILTPAFTWYSMHHHHPSGRVHHNTHMGKDALAVAHHHYATCQSCLAAEDNVARLQLQRVGQQAHCSRLPSPASGQTDKAEYQSHDTLSHAHYILMHKTKVVKKVRISQKKAERFGRYFVT